MTGRTWSVVATAGMALASASNAQLRYDLSEVTALANSALLGQNVQTPVPGFELLLLKDGVVVYQQAFGLIAPDEVVNCDSATKTLSGAVLMSVADQSATPFSLGTRVSQYIPAYAGDKAGITIRQCFSHTSGLTESSVEGNPDLTLQQAALVTAALPLQYAPGSAFAYGGSAMQTAGAVAELASGLTWNQLFAQRIAGPLGMVETYYALTNPQVPRVPGGAVSNAREFATFMEMLRRGGVHEGRRVLSTGAVAAMFLRQTQADIPVLNSPYNDSSDYGVGVWLDQRDPSGRLVGALAAGARGFSSWIDIDDGMVGCFATDLTSAQNVGPLTTLIRDAAQRAIRAGPVCVADFNRDGGIDGADVAAFFFSWERSGDGADVNEDGGVDVGDIEAFFSVWEAGGC